MSTLVTHSVISCQIFFVLNLIVYFTDAYSFYKCTKTVNSSMTGKLNVLIVTPLVS